VQTQSSQASDIEHEIYMDAISHSHIISNTVQSFDYKVQVSFEVENCEQSIPTQPMTFRKTELILLLILAL